MSHLLTAVSRHDHRQGPDRAKVVLVEYGDYECPACGRACITVEAIRRQLGPQLQLVFRNFPLTNTHLHAALAAEAAEAAGAQGRFWKMHDALFANQDRIGPELLHALAEELKLDVPRFDHELKQGIYRDRVRQDFMSGVHSGVNSTPTFFINGLRYDVPWDEDSLTAVLTLAAHEARPML
jgi:protein-disulfide isomerase